MNGCLDVVEATNGKYVRYGIKRCLGAIIKNVACQHYVAVQIQLKTDCSEAITFGVFRLRPMVELDMERSMFGGNIERTNGDEHISDY